MPDIVPQTISDHQRWLMAKLNTCLEPTDTNLERIRRYYNAVENKRLTHSQQDRHKTITEIYGMLKNSVVPAAHRTASGTIVSIACMTDEHLKNTIKLFLEPLTELTKRIEDSVKLMSPRAQALYGGDRKLIADNYGEITSKTYKRVGPYVLEAALRGGYLGADVQKLLRAAFGRSTQDLEGPTLEVNQVMTQIDEGTEFIYG